MTVAVFFIRYDEIVKMEVELLCCVCFACVFNVALTKNCLRSHFVLNAYDDGLCLDTVKAYLHFMRSHNAVYRCVERRG